MSDTTLEQVAVEITGLRQHNPMNHDGSNHMLDKVIQTLDRMAGDDGPSRAAAYAWAVRQDQYDDDYCKRHGVKRSGRTHVEQLAARADAQG